MPKSAVAVSLPFSLFCRPATRALTNRHRTPHPHTATAHGASTHRQRAASPMHTTVAHRLPASPPHTTIACRHRVSPSRVAIACRHRVSPSRTTPARHTRCPQRTRKRRPAERQTGRRRELLSGDGPASALRGDARSVEHLALHLHEVLLPGGVLTGGDDALQRCRGHEQSDDRRRWRRLICSV